MDPNWMFKRLAMLFASERREPNADSWRERKRQMGAPEAWTYCLSLMMRFSVKIPKLWSHTACNQQKYGHVFLVWICEYFSLHFSRMRSEGSRFTCMGVWGWGCVRQVLRLRLQPSATVGNRLRWRRKALHSGERVWRGPETVSNWVVSPQLYWSLQRRCLWEWSVAPQLYWSLQRRCLWEWSVSPQLYWCLQRRCLWEWSVAPQLYWSLQRRCLWEWSVSPQLYWCLQRRCLWEWSVAPQFYWCLQRRCLWEWSVAPQLYWCLQRRCLWEWSVAPHFYWSLQRRWLQRRCLWEISVSRQLF